MNVQKMQVGSKFLRVVIGTIMRGERGSYNVHIIAIHFRATDHLGNFDVWIIEPRWLHARYDYDDIWILSFDIP